MAELFFKTEDFNRNNANVLSSAYIVIKEISMTVIIQDKKFEYFTQKPYSPDLFTQ